ncbi:TPA: hypothetical protein EYO12_01580 [Candidatus Saccharibacteria bacterium]|nr:hypothetical protein [Candidatus Saccharibacteria bacterium]HIO87407.1 hypothetical protein [Candidatus Saccharibacteria bacterium]
MEDLHIQSKLNEDVCSLRTNDELDAALRGVLVGSHIVYELRTPRQIKSTEEFGIDYHWVSFPAKLGANEVNDLVEDLVQSIRSSEGNQAEYVWAQALVVREHEAYAMLRCGGQDNDLEPPL